MWSQDALAEGVARWHREGRRAKEGTQLSRLLLRTTGASPSEVLWEWGGIWLKLSLWRRTEKWVTFSPASIRKLSYIPSNFRQIVDCFQEYEFLSTSSLSCTVRENPQEENHASHRSLQQNTTASRGVVIVQGIGTESWQQMLHWSSMNV